jgi:hypothetical protein
VGHRQESDERGLADEGEDLVLVDDAVVVLGQGLDLGHEVCEEARDCFEVYGVVERCEPLGIWQPGTGFGGRRGGCGGGSAADLRRVRLAVVGLGGQLPIVLGEG